MITMVKDRERRGEDSGCNKKAKKKKITIGKIRTCAYEYIRTWVEPLRPLGHECFAAMLSQGYLSR